VSDDVWDILILLRLRHALESERPFHHYEQASEFGDAAQNYRNPAFCRRQWGWFSASGLPNH
jgi:hypothetical protein